MAFYLSYFFQQIQYVMTFTTDVRERAKHNSYIFKTYIPHIEDNTATLEDWEPVCWADADKAICRNGIVSVHSLTC